MSQSLTFIQALPSLAWTINHTFAAAPICDVMVEDNGVVYKMLPLSVKHVSDSQLLIEFSEPTAGRARLVGKFVQSEISGAGSIDFGQYYVAPPAPPAVGDPLFNYVVLLLHGEGVQDSSTIPDTSSYANVPTTNSGVGIETSYGGIFGTGQMRNGGLLYPSSTRFGIGTQDFTFEAFMRAGGNANQAIFSQIEVSANEVRPNLYVSNVTELKYFVAGTNWITSTVPLSTTVSKFVQLIRTGGVTTLYVDGVDCGSFNDTFDYGSSAYCIIGEYLVPMSGNSAFGGLMDEVRLTIGAARTPGIPTAAFPDSGVAFFFEDDFVGSAGTLNNRAVPNDGRIWTQANPGFALDGNGHLIVTSTDLFTDSPGINLPLGTNHTGAFAMEMAFSVPPLENEGLTGVTMDFYGDNEVYSISLLVNTDADFNAAVGTMTLSVGGADNSQLGARVEIPMPNPANPFTFRTEFAAGEYTMFVNGSAVNLPESTGTISLVLGANQGVYFTAGGNGNASSSMVVESIMIEELPGPL